MASRLFAKVTTGHYLAGATTLGVTGYLATKRVIYNDDTLMTPAEEQFLTSFGYYATEGMGTGQPYAITTPKDRGPPYFQIQNNYPKTSDLNPSSVPTIPNRGTPGDFLLEDAPWTKFCFKKDPEAYCKVIKEYCWAGNAINDFKIQNNTVRKWYHAPWMHYNQNGR
jgi:hypothetical protein